jgi:protein TonB
MSPSAVALAVLVHVAAALAIWWAMVHRPQVPPPPPEPIEVTIEQPKPPPKPAEAPKPPAPKQAESKPLPALGLPPPADITADKPSQAPSTAEKAQEALAPQRPSPQQAVPLPQSPPDTPPQQSSDRPPPEPPKVEAGKSEPSKEGIGKPPAAARAEERPAPAPAKPPAAQHPQFYPSPLRTAPQRQAPALARPETPSPSPFVNPADAYNRSTVADNYRWQIVAKLAGYRYYAKADVAEGLTVIKVVIARDGRLLDIQVARSSGVPAFDQGVVSGVRAGSPYAPLPSSISGDRASFILPLVSSHYE